jgi:energy-coupling factor transporter ATP-binding protein EcfA2
VEGTIVKVLTWFLTCLAQYDLLYFFVFFIKKELCNFAEYFSIKKKEMRKEFNTTGTCFPHLHYMADISTKFDFAISLVEKGKYFAINRPRQYGKTTMLESLSRALVKSDEWLVFNISFEGIDSQTGAEMTPFCQAFVRLLSRSMLNSGHSELEIYLKEKANEVTNLGDVSVLITHLVNKSQKKCVMLIDEVDKSSNNQLFLDFLAMLRYKYLNRYNIADATFHSVILAGLYDVKSLRLKLGLNQEAKYNSPWNIAADFNVVMELQPNEIVPMLEDYCQEQNVRMNTEGVANALFYYTAGYPFLVSALCKIVDEEIMSKKTERVWTEFDIETAADKLIKAERSTTNFDTLVKNLENSLELYDLIYRLVIEGEYIPYNLHAPVVNFALQHGIVGNSPDGLVIHNRIYREVIANYMTVKTIVERKSLNIETSAAYLLDNNALDMRKVLLKFQELMKIEYSKKDDSFIERNGRLIFLAFLKPIINGKGYAFKEPEISEEKRMDIAVSFFQHKYIIELKMWYGNAAHKKGLVQLGDYLDRQNQSEGYLVIFEQNVTKTWKKGWIRANGKKVFAVWV